MALFSCIMLGPRICVAESEQKYAKGKVLRFLKRNVCPLFEWTACFQTENRRKKHILRSANRNFRSLSLDTIFGFYFSSFAFEKFEHRLSALGKPQEKRRYFLNLPTWSMHANNESETIHIVNKSLFWFSIYILCIPKWEHFTDGEMSTIEF